MEMEDLVHDFPFAIYSKQRKQVGEPMAAPVLEFQADRGHCLDHGDVDNPALKLCCWTIPIIPVKDCTGQKA